VGNQTGRLVATCRILLPVLLMAACTVPGASGRPTASRPPTTLPPVSPGHSPDVTTTRGPQPPESGAWLGAWVRPQRATPAGRAEAFSAFEQRIGNQLRIAHMYHDWDNEVLGPADHALADQADLLLLSWAGTDTRSMALGTYDPLIRQTAERIKEYGRPVLLRFRWEMDRPNLAASVHSPADYIAAWRHTRGIFTEVGAMNAGWVWCPHVLGFNEAERNAVAYYPGDDEVDWLCTDVYPGPDFASYSGLMNAFMAFASKHPRPIIIGEFAVQSTVEPAQRAAWLREVRTHTLNHPQVRALVYFAVKQDKGPLFDTTFADDPAGLAAFQELAADSYFNSPPPTGDR